MVKPVRGLTITIIIINEVSSFHINGSTVQSLIMHAHLMMQDLQQLIILFADDIKSKQKTSSQCACVYVCVCVVYRRMHRYLCVCAHTNNCFLGEYVYGCVSSPKGCINN